MTSPLRWRPTRPPPRTSTRWPSFTAGPTCAGSMRPRGGRTCARRASRRWWTCWRPGSSSGPGNDRGADGGTGMSTDAAPGARPAGPGDLDRVVELMVGAFYSDPVWSWAFPDPDLREAQHRRFWRLYVEGAARYSSVWLNAGE